MSEGAGEGPLEADDTRATSAPALCPECRAARAGPERYCERCGHDFSAAESGWEVVIVADPEQFERVAQPGLEFPSARPERRIPLEAREVAIGCRRGDADPPPDIDLGGSDGDPAVSRLHALLVRRDDGGYSIVDKGSTNGTTLNGAEAPIAAETAVPLADGDCVNIGAWTRITLRRTPEAGDG